MEADSIFLLNQMIQNLQLKMKDTGAVLCGDDWTSVNCLFPYDSIGYVNHGRIYMEVNGKGSQIDEGGMYYIPAMNPYSHHALCKDTETYYVHFEMNMPGHRLSEKIDFPVSVRPSEPERIARIYERLFSSKNSHLLGAPLQSTGLTCEIAAAFFQLCQEYASLKDTGKAGKMLDIIEYIQKNLNKNLTVELLTSQIGLAPNYFIRVFRQFFHETPMHFVLNEREKTARKLLEHSELSIKEIGLSLGFANQNYFSEFFKKRNGFSPSEYRRLKRKSP